MIRTAVFDLDGVIRHFDRRTLHAVAEQHGLSAEVLLETAFEPALLRSLVTGQRTRASWVREVGVRLGLPEAAEQWLCDDGRVDPDVVTLIRRVRASGVSVAILTNGTDTIDAELVRLGVRQDFDAVVSTWHLGVAKPDPAAFERTCARLGVAPTEAFFTDDRRANISAASRLGLSTHLFEGAVGLKDALVMHGLLVP